MCQAFSRLFRRGWLPLSFLRGKELVVLGLGGLLVVWALGLGATLWNLPSQPHGQPLGNPSKFLPADLPSGRPPLLSIAWEVCHRSSLSSTLPHNQGEVIREGSCQNLEMPQKADAPVQYGFSYLPSIVRITPGSVHLVLSCCNVCPRLSTRHPRLYLYRSSVLALQDSLGRM